MRSYLDLIRKHPGLLAFGFFGTFFSGFGQTYFISLFNTDIRDAFSLSHGEFSMIYSLATLASGVSLIWLGQLVDRIRLQTFVIAVCLGLAFACALLASASTWIILLLSIFLLRLHGQGLISHAAITTMARCFHTARGKALSIAAMGFAAAEGIFPAVAVMVVAITGWRTGWGIFAAILVFVALPWLLWLLRGSSCALIQEALPDGTSRDGTPSWSTRQVIRDPLFFLIIPAATATPAIVTGIFFHQLFIAEQKAWSLSLIASGFSLFAIIHILSIFFMGPLVDRLGARTLLPCILLPMALGVTLLAFLCHPFILFLYMALVAITLGSAHPVINSLWAEAYGTRFLGSIRALNQGIMVVSTAIAPVLMGLAIDANISLQTIALAITLYILVCTGLATTGAIHLKRREDNREKLY
ncbi:MFS transporter [Desulfurispirillum indicum]|uniref:Major facilitator superfamily MFS_1 n=1 Tax=Desulfurispirillum indicum (strain ATCC BAA-1389 / DSM 22839 / S5) TaxID=653733 RepID=E6W1S0_DESIS|nr:MFS transporter [Desulfurispirillum indicum]ADU65452.1 major facilitator superfamily MFS_1 [Desulfurispirillum indicum S5]UCZ57372.1 MFS transporter [Desulfurispirillum indicum]